MKLFLVLTSLSFGHCFFNYQSSKCFGTISSDLSGCSATLFSNGNVELDQISLENEISTIEFDSVLSRGVTFLLKINPLCSDFVYPSSISFTTKCDGNKPLFSIGSFTTLNHQLIANHTELVDEQIYGDVAGFIIVVSLICSTLKKKNKSMKTNKRFRRSIMTPRPCSTNGFKDSFQIDAFPLPVKRQLFFDEVDETTTEHLFNNLASKALSMPVISPSSPIKIKINREDFSISNPLFSHSTTLDFIEPSLKHSQWNKIHGPKISPTSKTKLCLLKRRALALRLKLIH